METANPGPDDSAPARGDGRGGPTRCGHGVTRVVDNPPLVVQRPPKSPTG